MTLQEIRSALGWSTIINWVFLVWWFLFILLAHDWTYRLHKKWFNLSVETFDTIHYTGLALYKIGIILFNLAPYLALRIIG